MFDVVYNSEYTSPQVLYTTEFGERSIGLEIFQVAAQNLHDPNTALHCSAAAPIVVAAYIAGDLTLNLGKPLSGRKL